MRWLFVPLKNLRNWLLFVLAFAVLVVPGNAVAGSPPDAQSVTLTPIGNPTWKPVDFHLFSAPIGDVDSGYAEFGETMAQLLPPPNHAAHPQLGIGPGEPHRGPYKNELDHGVRDAGFREETQFSASEFSEGAGVYLLWMNAPDPGVKGSSPDFVRGPIIPNSLFPIHFSGITLRNGEMFNPAVFDTDVPALDANLDPPFAVDGHSHFPFFAVDNADFGPPNSQLSGSYVYDITLTDASGAGWHIEARFSVMP